MEPVELQKKKSLPAGVDGDTAGRIKNLFEHHSASIYEVSRKLGHGRNSKLYKVLSGDVKPGYETLVEILTMFPSTSAEWLLMGKGPMLRGAGEVPMTSGNIMTARPTAPAERGLTSGQVLAVTVDRLGNENTLLVPIRAQAGYQRAYNEPVYLQNMIPYHIPGFENGTFRAFEVAGDSMSPSFGHRDIVVCSYVERWDLLKPWESYVVVTPENVLLKRIGAIITDRRAMVTLYSDNSQAYPPYELPVADLSELWMVRGYLSNNPPGRPDALIERLREVIEALGHDYHEVRRYLEENAPSVAPSEK